MTLTSLSSCFTIWSSGADCTSTAIVIREKRASSVGATASEWMLNPRRANRPATRVSTPALFSTRTERMWCLAGADMSPTSFAVGGVDDDVVVGHAGRHHRVHLLARVGAEVDDHRA